MCRLLKNNNKGLFFIVVISWRLYEGIVISYEVSVKIFCTIRYKKALLF